jgi:hypothetical protein
MNVLATRSYVEDHIAKTLAFRRIFLLCRAETFASLVRIAADPETCRSRFRIGRSVHAWAGFYGDVATIPIITAATFTP